MDTLVRLGKRILRLGEPERSRGRVVGDGLKPVYGLFGDFYIACFRGYCGLFSGHIVCHILP